MGSNWERWADRGPYYLGVGMGTKHSTDAARKETLFGTVLHVALWSAIAVLDWILVFHTSPLSDTSHPFYHVLMLGAAIPLFISAAAVVVTTIVHILAAVLDWELDFNDGHLPAFLTTTILGGARSSHTFTMLILIAWVSQGTTAGNELDNATRDRLVLQLVLKQLGVSFTANAHRFAVPGGYVKAE